MKLYLISQDVNNAYDTYDSAVVAAKSEEEAKAIHPSPQFYVSQSDGWAHIYFDGTTKYEGERTDCWCAPHEVKVEYIGESKTAEAGSVICASFNAG